MNIVTTCSRQPENKGKLLGAGMPTPTTRYLGHPTEASNGENTPAVPLSWQPQT